MIPWQRELYLYNLNSRLPQAAVGVLKKEITRKDQKITLSMCCANRVNAICLISDWPGHDEINMAQTFAYFETNGDIENNILKQEGKQNDRFF